MVKGSFRLTALFALALAMLVSLAPETPTPALAAPKNEAKKPAKKPVYIPGQYIVVFNEGVKKPDEEAAQIAAGGVEVDETFDSCIKGFSGRMPDRVVEALRNDQRVKYIEQDQVCTICAQEIPTGIRRIDGPDSFAKSGDGTGTTSIVVAVIDTGIDLTHPDLNVDKLKSKSYVRKGRKYTSPNDDNGHGSHVAGTIAAKDDGNGVVGVAPGATLWAVKVLNASGSGTYSQVISGINYVTANAGTVKVANLSLGGGYSQSVNDAVKNCVNAGVVVCVAAGNSDADAANYSPASEKTALTVAALADSNGLPGGGGPSTSYGADDTIATFSNWSNDTTLVDLIAPGVSIKSTYKGGGYTTYSGTSMATPHVAGLAALYRSRNPNDTPAQVRTALINGAGEQIAGRHGESRTYPLINAKNSVPP